MPKCLTAAYAAGLVAVLAVGGGCGSDDDHAATIPPPTATATMTSGPAGTPTATPLPSIAGEEDLFGSTAQAAGALTIKAVPLVPAYFSTCLGGSATNCEGGSSIYVGTDPGFKEADTDNPAAPLFALPDGVTVSLEVIAIDPALSLRFDNGTLNAAGQSLVLGTTPGIHADLQWQLVLSANAAFSTVHPVTLKLATTASGFADSAEFTAIVRPSTGAAPSES